jgi:pimeloyl-ACP methyl ester carboxylesterase
MTDGMAAYVADLEKHVVPGSWHYLPEEKPEELNRLAISWLRRRLPMQV